MKKITIFTSTGLIGIKIKSLLKNVDTFTIEVQDGYIKNGQNLEYMLKHTSLIIVDMDTRQFKPATLIKQIKEEKSIKDIPMLALTSQEDMKELKQVVDIGCSDFLIKPFTKETLTDKVIAWIDKKVTIAENVNYANYHREKTIQWDNEEDIIEETFDVKLSWSDAFKIGVEEIDKEHKMIIDHFEELYELMKKGGGHEYYKELVNFLEQYVDTHFAHEEELHLKYNYDRIKEHKAQHEEFKKKIKEIIGKGNSKEVTNMDLIRINMFIKDWLVHHILIEDGRLGNYIMSKNFFGDGILPNEIDEEK